MNIDSLEEDLDEDFLESDNELAVLNQSIKLDLWLNDCVDKKFAENFLKYNSFEFRDDESLTHQIISNFKLEEIMTLRYASRNFDIIPKLKALFLPLGVISIVDVAKKYGVKISLTKEGLIDNFLRKFSPYELIILLNNEGFDIFSYLDISALEQLYLLDNEDLDDLSKGKCFSLDDSKYKMLSCVLKHYKDGFLVSHNRYDRGYDL